jgi:hypothetical protein
VRWLFAAIWLVYLAQPASKLWSDPDLAHRYLGLADLIAFSAVFIAAFAAARFLRDQRNRRLSRQLGVAAVAAEAVFVLLAYIVLGPSASSLFIYVSVMAVFMLPTRAGWTVVARWRSRSSCPPWPRGAWARSSSATHSSWRPGTRSPGWPWPTSAISSPATCTTSSVTR